MGSKDQIPLDIFESVGIYDGAPSNVFSFLLISPKQGNKALFPIVKKKFFFLTSLHLDCLIKEGCVLEVKHNYTYSETCLKWPLKNRQNKGLKAMW